MDGCYLLFYDVHTVLCHCFIMYHVVLYWVLLYVVYCFNEYNFWIDGIVIVFPRSFLLEMMGGVKKCTSDYNISTKIDTFGRDGKGK